MNGGSHMQLIEKAIEVATEAHQAQMRKATTIPYIAHPYAVGMYLLQAGCTEEVVCADKLHNIRSTKADLASEGNRVWERFKRGKEQQEWYYRGILESVEVQLDGERIFEEYKEEVELVFG